MNEGNDDRGETSRMTSGDESDILNEPLELLYRNIMLLYRNRSQMTP